MNATTNTELTAVQTPTAPAFNTSSAALMMDMGALDRMERFANLMAAARATVPTHFQCKPGDCLAVVMQATTWGMNPFAVAQKTHVINGVLGYEAQLVASAINSSSLLADRFKFEWFGPWEKIVGKFKMVESKTKKDDNGNPKKFIVPDWETKDEIGLGVRVWATIKGETEPRFLELLMTQARTRNSTLWTEDPKQQLAYLAQKRWARLYAPDVILGVYTPDEVQEFSAPLDMGKAEVLDTRPALDEDALIKEGWANAEKGMNAFGPWFNALPKLADGKQREILKPHRHAMLAKAKQVDDARTINQAHRKAEAEGVTYEDLKTKIENAQTVEALMIAADWIEELKDPAQREELTKRYMDLHAKFGGAA